ncbi:MauE/DoxX family redox-associated membrane protein [Actinomadura flavalba]|uniref:MauE/DoxX family redox-associated membrane protein n=1 Tax=Actinomadura flavalba TaxID=1120938 RepID=UPI001F0AB88F|nr:MauE/DoxX family redox-associated membrane protein [Actinomadura flavalba]
MQNTQVLLLAGVLLAACLAKLVLPAPAGPGLRGRRAGVAVAVGEGTLGVALLVTSHLSVRLATSVAFAAATWIVGELRTRRPDDGCGCFGALSTHRVDRRSVLRGALFTAAALAALTAPHAGVAALRNGTLLMGCVLALELAVFGMLSPELSSFLDRRRLRRRPDPPCERRHSPLDETYRRLRSSAAWTTHEAALAGAEPLDVWREGCWRFVVYALDDEREVVFAVSTAARDATVRAAVIATDD